MQIGPKRLLIYLLLTIAAGKAFPQKMDVCGTRFKDSFFIRCLPADPAIWQQISKSGIGIIICKQDANGKRVKTRFQLLKSDTLHKDLLSALRDSCFASIEKNCKNISEVMASKQEQELRFFMGMLAAQKDFKMALHNGLGFCDKLENEYFKSYKIFIPGNSDTMILNESRRSYAWASYAKLAIERAGERVILKISHQFYPEYPSSFHLLKSTDGKIFRPLTTEPFNTGFRYSKESVFQFADTTGNEDTIFYKILADDGFGHFNDTGEIVFVALKAHNESRPEFLRYVTLENGPAISWKFDTSSQKTILGFQLHYTDSIDGVDQLYTQKLIPADQRIFRLNDSCKSGYYSIVAVSEDLTPQSSLPVLIMITDSIAPIAPIVVSCSSDSSGMVQIRWNKNGEPDFLGYQVYRANFRDEVYTNISSKWNSDTFFSEQMDLHWKRDSVFYRIVSTDRHYNESGASMIVALPVRHRLPPASPLIISATASKSQVVLKWTASASAIVYEVYRKTGDKDFVLLKNISRSSDSVELFYDKELRPDFLYTYKIRACGNNGACSGLSPEMAVKTEENAFLAPVIFTDYYHDSSNGKVYLKWENPNENTSHLRLIHLAGNRNETIMVCQKEMHEVTVLCKADCGLNNYRIIVYDQSGRRSK